MFNTIHAVTTAVGLLFLAGPLVAGPPPFTARQDAERLDFYEKHVRPVLVDHCYQCHSADSRKLKGDLRVDSAASLLMDRAATGPAVVPGVPDSSLLIKAVRQVDRELQMPPDGRLDDTAIAHLVAWVEMGAPLPNESGGTPRNPSADQARQHWSFQPPRHHPDPPVRNKDWPVNSIDYFILAELEKREMVPAPPADKRVLIRRATFDLTGLPPTPAEIDAFLADSSESAFSKVVDRLLDSGHYGEQWGRHWLDLARYADTAGDSADYPIPQARLYRDYVIDAFNRDKPYDEFLREQIAGDLLPASSDDQRRERTIATGFLALSRRFGVGPERNWHLTIEDTIDTLSKSVLGLSVGCARCHDHKYDPVPTADYYGLYGIFASMRYPYAGSEEFRRQKDLIPLLPEDKLRELTSPFASELAAIDEEMADLNAELEGLRRAKRARTTQPAAPAQETPKPIRPRAEVLEAIRTVQKRKDKLTARMPPIPLAYAVSEGKPQNARIHQRGQPHSLGPEVPRGFLDILGGQKLPPDVKDSGRRQLAEWLIDPKNPLTARVMVNRIWQYHFGRGIVRTPSDFGSRGQAPTHPELLDELALRFIESGWSIKAMHRLIMGSRTYQMACGSTPAATDPNNDWFSRIERRRLSAEELRDALLAVSGGMDISPPGDHPFPAESTWSFTQHNAFSAVYEDRRRSVYQMQQRLKRHPYFAVFDGADTNASTAQRLVSTTPLQALFMMNDQFVFEQADRLASRLVAERPDDRSRIDLAHQLLLGRPATADEAAVAERYVRQYTEKLRTTTQPSDRDGRDALASYLRVLFSSNEFVYLD